MSITVYDKNGQPYEAGLVDGDKFRQLETELQAAHAETVRLLEEAVLHVAYTGQARLLHDEIRAHLFALKGLK